MESVRIQTAFRLPQDLVTRLKYKARQQKKSLNAFVQDLLEREAGSTWPVLPEGFKVSDEIKGLRVASLPKPSERELDADPKLAYLWNKYGK